MKRIGQLNSLEELIENNYVLFNEEFHKGPDFSAIAPGRINIIGEHTDYNLGLSMPAGINKWVIASFSERRDNKVNIKSLTFKSHLSFSIGFTPKLSESWQQYVFGAFSVFKEVAKVDHGFDAYIWGNVPVGSGVSSSAALEVAVMNGLRAMYHADLSDVDLVKLCQRVENEHLGVKSGLLDQYASQFSREGEVMVLDFKNLSHQYIDFNSQDYEWVLVDSKIRRELANSAYSDRVRETSNALKLIKGKIDGVEDFRDLKENYLDLLPNEIWRKRLKHYLSENARVLQAIDAIQSKDFVQLGKLLLASHTSLKNDYEVSCEQLDFLVEELQNEYCLGSRMMGGGFGGCTINLVAKDGFNDFKEIIRKSYRSKFNIEPGIEKYKLVQGAFINHY
jgi:galactokinase